MAGYVLALDLGTTGNKAIVFDEQQKVVASSYQEFPQIFPRPGWVEHDPEAIWATTRSVMQDVLAAVDASRIGAIGITNQRETVVAWDRRDGRPIHNAIVWQCRRTAPRCEVLKSNGHAERIRLKTGLVIDAYFSGSKIEWLLENVPGARDLADAGHLAVGTIDTWITWKLSGGKAHVTDPSNASRTMLFNLRESRWDEDMCALFDVPSQVLPAIVPSSGELALTDPSVTGREMLIGGLIGDQQAALFGQGCIEPGIVKNTYGTGLFVLMNTADQTPVSRNLLTTVAWQVGGKVDFAVEGSIFVGGAAVQWTRDQLGIIGSADETERLAAELRHNDGVYFVPALVGLGAPFWDPEARGTIIGLTRGTGRAHLVRAALESIAYQTRDVLEAAREELHLDTRKLQVDGGASANNFLMQFQADILGVPVERPAVVETTALGAAGMAGLACGLWSSPAEFASRRLVDRTFEPTMDAATRDALYARWLEAVSRTRRWATI